MSGTLTDLLRDAQAATASRTMYRAAAERHEEQALRLQDAGKRIHARIRARLALRLQDEAAYTGDVVQDRLARYVG